MKIKYSRTDGSANARRVIWGRLVKDQFAIIILATMVEPALSFLAVAIFVSVRWASMAIIASTVSLTARLEHP